MSAENFSVQKKMCPSSILSTTNPTWTDPDLCAERPVTDYLSHSTANNSMLEHPYGWHVKKKQISMMLLAVCCNDGVLAFEDKFNLNGAQLSTYQLWKF
jgi:hypothetical protein